MNDLSKFDIFGFQAEASSSDEHVLNHHTATVSSKQCILLCVQMSQLASLGKHYEGLALQLKRATDTANKISPTQLYLEWREAKKWDKYKKKVIGNNKWLIPSKSKSSLPSIISEN